MGDGTVYLCAVLILEVLVHFFASDHVVILRSDITPGDATMPHGMYRHVPTGSPVLGFYTQALAETIPVK